MVKEIITCSDIIMHWDIIDRKSESVQYYTYIDGELGN